MLLRCPWLGMGQGWQQNKPFRFRCFKSEMPRRHPSGPLGGQMFIELRLELLGV